MNDENYNHFNLITSGRIKPGHPKQQVIQQVAELFQVPRASVKTLLNGQKTVLKKDLPHKKAYQYLNALQSLGVEASIERIIIEELSPQYSFVPQGEEQTPYSQLSERLRQGEKIACSKCQFVQPLAPICQECGKPLLGKVVAEDSLKPSSGLGKFIKISLLILLAIILFTWLYSTL